MSSSQLDEICLFAYSKWLGIRSRLLTSTTTYPAERSGRHPEDLYTESGQTLQGLFSAVSKPKFASKF